VLRGRHTRRRAAARIRRGGGTGGCRERAAAGGNARRSDLSRHAAGRCGRGCRGHVCCHHGDPRRPAPPFRHPADPATWNPPSATPAPQRPAPCPPRLPAITRTRIPAPGARYALLEEDRPGARAAWRQRCWRRLTTKAIRPMVFARARALVALLRVPLLPHGSALRLDGGIAAHRRSPEPSPTVPARGKISAPYGQQGLHPQVLIISTEELSILAPLALVTV
jgi:hypothetical protein